MTHPTVNRAGRRTCSVSRTSRWLGRRQNRPAPLSPSPAGERHPRSWVARRGGRMAEDTDAAEGVSLADREDLVAYARRMAPDDLAPGTSGNLSVRRGELMAITPSGMPNKQMTPADICLVRTSDAELLSGPRPSTETPMHLAMYQASHAEAIVHTHSPFVVALSTV